MTLSVMLGSRSDKKGVNISDGKYIRLYITRAIGDLIGRTSSFESMSIYVLRSHDSNNDTLFQLNRRSVLETTSLPHTK